MKPRNPDSLPIGLLPWPGSVARALLNLLSLLVSQPVLPVVGPFIVPPGLPVGIVVWIHLIGMIVLFIFAVHGCTSCF